MLGIGMKLQYIELYIYIPRSTERRVIFEWFLCLIKFLRRRHMYIYIDLTVYFRALVLCFGSQKKWFASCVWTCFMFLGETCGTKKQKSKVCINIYIYIYKRIFFSKWMNLYIYIYHISTYMYIYFFVPSQIQCMGQRNPAVDRW